MLPGLVDFPLLASYLEGLPHGLASHPGARTRTDFSIILRSRLASILRADALPQALHAQMTVPWKAGDWMPMTLYAALCAVARDRLWTTEESYHRGMFEVATEMYSGPIYRALFFMFGPSLVAMGAAQRWHTLHQGTELINKKQHKESLELQLNYPHKLLPATAVRSLGAAFCAIAEGSRGKNSAFTLVSHGDTSAELGVRWTYSA